jgi:hypothetical protein
MLSLKLFLLRDSCLRCKLNCDLAAGFAVVDIYDDRTMSNEDDN